MRRFWLVFLVATVLGLISLGAVMLAEVAFRIAGPKLPIAARVNTIYFEHQEYVVSTHPANLVQRVEDRDSFWQGAEANPECVAEDGVRVRFNNSGLRSPRVDPPPPRQENEFRVVIVGGSAAIGWGVAEKCTLTERLREALEKKLSGRHVRVFNIGSGAWKSFQELISIQRYGLSLRPDVVLAFNFFNDIQQSYDMQAQRSYYTGVVDHAFSLYKARENTTLRDFAQSFASVRWLRSYIASTQVQVGLGGGGAQAELPLLAVAPEPGRLQTRLTGLPVDLAAAGARTDFDPLNRFVVDNYLRNVRLMARAADMAGAKFYVALQPTLYLKNPLAPRELNSLTRNYAHTVNFVAQGYSRVAADLARLAGEESNFRFLDLSRVFEGNPAEIFTDYVHFWPLGYEIVAVTLAEELVK
jgi:lysophospholipase L1-like esterase